MAAALGPIGIAQTCSPVYPPVPYVPDDNSERVLRVSLDGNDEDIDSTFDGTGLPCTQAGPNQLGGNKKGPSHPWVSDDGDRIVYSAAPVAMPGVPFDMNVDQRRHVFLRVVSAGTNGETYLLSGTAPATTAIGMKAESVADHDAPSDFPTMTGDGKWVTWASDSATLPGAALSQGNVQDIFLHEVDAQSTTWISRVGVTSGQGANGDCYRPFISGDGRYIAFESKATNLHGAGYVPAGCPGFAPASDSRDIFLLDRGVPQVAAPSITWVSVGLTSSGTCPAPPTGATVAERDCRRPSVSEGGCYVEFESAADNLTPLGNPSGVIQVYLRDMTSGETILVSKTLFGMPGIGPSRFGMVSRDGNWVVFESADINMVPNDNNGDGDVFVWSRLTEETTRVSIDSNGLEIDDQYRGVTYPFITGDGRFVFFTWPGPNFNGPGTGVDMMGQPINNPYEFYVHDRDYDLDGELDAGPDDTYQPGEVRTIRVGDRPGPVPTGPGNHWTGGNACASVDGRFVVYMSRASDHVDAADIGGVDTNGDANCDMCTGVGFGHLCPAWQGRDIFRRELFVVAGEE